MGSCGPVGVRRCRMWGAALLLAVAVAPLQAASLKSTEKWFAPGGPSTEVVARLAGRKAGLRESVEYLFSEQHAQQLGESLDLIRTQVRSDSIPCKLEDGGSRFRYRDRDPARALETDQDWAPWQEDSNRNLRWAHQGLSLLGCYMDPAGDGLAPADVDEISLLLEDWYADNAVVDLPDPEFSWGDHTIAYRLRRMVALYLMLRDQDMLDERSAGVILQMVYTHTRLLLEEPEVRNRRSNHALDQAQALFMSGMTFPFLKYSRPVVEEAHARAMAEADFLIAPDGVQTENSPAYHQWVPVKVFSLVTAMSEHLGEPLPEDFKARMTGAARFATWITRPDGMLPMIGDTGRGSRSRFRAEPGVDRQLRQHLEYARSGGERGEAPGAGIAYFEESGYMIYRNAWSRGLRSDDVHLVFKCGFLSHGHRHGDDGSIVLYAYGSDWLTDAGMYGYEHKSPERKYAVSPMAHNLSVPVGMRVVGRMSNPRYREHSADWGLTADPDRNAAGCRSFQYLEAEYGRDISLSGQGVRLVDTFSGEALADHRISTLFRTPAEKQVDVDEVAGEVRICDADGRCLRIGYDRDVITDVVVSRGEDEHGFSFDTGGYLETVDIQTVRLFWADGARQSGYLLAFDGADAFGAGLPGVASPGSTAGVVDAPRRRWAWAILAAAGVGLLLGLRMLKGRTGKT